MSWIKTSDRLPEKTGNVSYEQIPCLVVYKGYVEILLWNCQDLCWDGNDGDDYECDPLDVTHWMPLPEPPKKEEQKP